MVHIATDTTTEPETVGVFVRGQLDLTAASAFREGLTRATRTSRAVELHLGRVDFIDGCGLSMLMDAISRARRAGRELRIVDASRCVCRLIDITDTADSLALLPVGSAGWGKRAGDLVGERTVGGRFETGDDEQPARRAPHAAPRPAFKS
jgi:anti-anti-sigma factor